MDNERIHLTIDGQPVSVPPGTTIRAAAEQVGIAIPVLCHRPGMEPSGSCMVCAVKVNGRPGFVPSCALRAESGMIVQTDGEEIASFRRSALELLLSDHRGECLASCQRTCPAGMDIPRMIRAIKDSRWEEAIRIVKATIALPAILGRICPAPCEKGCRRASVDQPLSICLLKRYVADFDLIRDQPWRPECRPSTGRRVAIIGGGPAGLAAAYELVQAGYGCTIFEKMAVLGGAVQREVPEQKLAKAVLDREIAQIIDLGVEVCFGARVGDAIELSEVRRTHDAVLIATGSDSDETWRRDFPEWGGSKGQLQVDSKTGMTAIPGLFAAGGVVAPMCMAVSSLAAGRRAAQNIIRWLGSEPLISHHMPFTSHWGALSPHDRAALMIDASPSGRQAPSEEMGYGLKMDAAQKEAARCMHCDCRRASDCGLRELSERLQTRVGRFHGLRRPVEFVHCSADIVFESGKCIACGACIQASSRMECPGGGLAFIGRGFGVKVSPALGLSWSDIPDPVIKRCLEVCPTGAFAHR